MSDLTIFGATQSRTLRCLWIAKELGLDYEQIEVSPRDPATRTPEFLACNPSGKVPALRDGAFSLSESMAINLYLAKKHGGPLQPTSLEDEAKTWQWSFWVMTEVEKPLLAYLFASGRLPGMAEDKAAMAENEKALQAPLGHLDAALSDRDYLLGGDFSVCDLNVASVMTWGRAARLDTAAFPEVTAWMERCVSRPALKAASGR